MTGNTDVRAQDQYKQGQGRQPQIFFFHLKNHFPYHQKYM